MKYHTAILQRKLGEKIFVMEAIRDLDEAIDMLCASLTKEEGLDPFAPDKCPYFGILWPASEALAQYIFEHPDLVLGKSVLELGAGLGFPSLVAASLGAQVLATDFHPDVEEFFLRNCRHSVIDCDYQRLNWREGELNAKFDVVMGSDVLYESHHPLELAKGLIRYMKPGGIILLSDPGRNYLQKFLEAMKELKLEVNAEMQSVVGKICLVYEFHSTADIG